MDATIDLRLEDADAAGSAAGAEELIANKRSVSGPPSSTFHLLQHIALASSEFGPLKPWKALVSTLHLLNKKDESSPEVPPGYGCDATLPAAAAALATAGVALYCSSPLSLELALSSAFPEDSVSFHQLTVRALRPAHAILVVKTGILAGSVIVSVRGTASVADLLSDFAGKPHQYNGSNAHTGMAACANAMLSRGYSEEVLPSLVKSGLLPGPADLYKPTEKEAPPYKVGLVEVLWQLMKATGCTSVWFTGHSLGAGVATLLCARIRALFFLRAEAESAPAAPPARPTTSPLVAFCRCLVPVHAFAIAPPACVAPDLAALCALTPQQARAMAAACSCAVPAAGTTRCSCSCCGDGSVAGVVLDGTAGSVGAPGVGPTGTALESAALSGSNSSTVVAAEVPEPVAQCCETAAWPIVCSVIINDDFVPRCTLASARLLHDELAEPALVSAASEALYDASYAATVGAGKAVLGRLWGALPAMPAPLARAAAAAAAHAAANSPRVAAAVSHATTSLRAGVSAVSAGVSARVDQLLDQPQVASAVRAAQRFRGPAAALRLHGVYEQLPAYGDVDEAVAAYALQQQISSVTVDFDEHHSEAEAEAAAAAEEVSLAVDGEPPERGAEGGAGAVAATPLVSPLRDAAAAAVEEAFAPAAAKEGGTPAPPEEEAAAADLVRLQARLQRHMAASPLCACDAETQAQLVPPGALFHLTPVAVAVAAAATAADGAEVAPSPSPSRYRVVRAPPTRFGRIAVTPRFWADHSKTLYLAAVRAVVAAQQQQHHLALVEPLPLAAPDASASSLATASVQPSPGAAAAASGNSASGSGGLQGWLGAAARRFAQPTVAASPG